MKTDELMSKLFGFSIPTYYNWKKENRPIIKLINKYFQNEELIEFLETSYVSKYDVSNKIMENFVLELNSFYYPNNHIEYLNITNPHKFFWDFLFRFKDEIASIDKVNLKEKLTILLYQYQNILLNISKIINYPESKFYESTYKFINKIISKDEKFLLYFINTINYKVTRTYDKNEINIDMENINFLNSFLSEESLLSSLHEYKKDTKNKDFFELYEMYLVNNNLNH
ncbi:hypothetical protein L5F42_08780 [Aliarcobacter butzleri]|uniref:hypothetical protein n=1 Tax=Aliarcobacter butzleri TaxID=28197 RepID=UPI001EDFB7BA|nr:hypothetical protein [Aliarcobacter butzleri]MCG3699927.1 hypothetical protein [Aliarcobacter butzleri]